MSREAVRRVGEGSFSAFRRALRSRIPPRRFYGPEPLVHGVFHVEHWGVGQAVARGWQVRLGGGWGGRRGAINSGRDGASTTDPAGSCYKRCSTWNIACRAVRGQKRLDCRGSPPGRRSRVCGETPRRTESGEAPRWQGVTREHIRHM